LAVRHYFQLIEVDQESIMKKRSLLVGALALGVSAASHASVQEGWKYEIAPYIWGVGVDADVGVGNRVAEVDNSGFDNVDATFSALGVISYNRWVFYLDYDYISISDDGKTKRTIGNTLAGAKASIDTDVNILTAAFGYRFDTFGENSWVDVLVGARTANFDTEVEVGNSSVDGEKDVTDPMLLLRPSFRISDNWRFTGLFGFGGGGDSDSTYELMPQFQYSFNDLVSLRFGYKRIYYDVNDGQKYQSNYRSFDGSFNGPFLGIGFTWPTPHKAAPVAAAPPPAKCSDADKDGVCDSADQCPNTPPGKHVGPAGCDCDYTLVTHFEFDSAELLPEDKAQLDKLAQTLNNPKLHFVTGVVDGYTDSTGKPEYNQKLSERRAQAVADYLQSKGVAHDSKMSVHGYGEDDPAADNGTPEGQAKNRRVVIRRTDCSK
jgi:outer membrane protein OmpA-like peptidoglycan-associated protein